MKRIDFYALKNLNSDQEVFDYFFSSITPNNQTWDYFTNWDKIKSNINNLKKELKIVNSLCGSENFDEDLKSIIQQFPNVIQVFPILLGIKLDKEKKIRILDDSDLPNFNYKDFDFSSRDLFSNEDLKDYVLFVKKSGLKDLILDEELTNIVNYARGVQVGLDTNGRKNRSGKIMEGLVENLLINIYDLDNTSYMSQGNPNKIRQLWGKELPVDRSSRKPDFVIYKNNKLYWIETNFYSGGGTKIKSTCGEYKDLNNFCYANDVDFIWITDGQGLETTKKPFEETFKNNNYIFNLSMVKEGILNYVWD